MDIRHQHPVIAPQVRVVGVERRDAERVLDGPRVDDLLGDEPRDDVGAFVGARVLERRVARGVRPFRSTRQTSRRYASVAVSPPAAAQCAQVHPRSLATCASAPAASSVRTAATPPCHAAQ